MTEVSEVLPPVVSDQGWQEALAEQLVLEKELTKHKDAVAAARRRLPMVRITADYLFEGDNGPATLLDLFGTHQQLIVYHFMFGADWDAGCEGCSWVADAMTHPAHLAARGTSLVVVSRADHDRLDQYRQRMGWNFPWYSCGRSSEADSSAESQPDFNTDMGVTVEGDEWHGLSVFVRDHNDVVYRTYFTGDRGVEHLGTHWTYLDLTPFGRQETWEDSPSGWPQTEPYQWHRRHDEY